MPETEPEGYFSFNRNYMGASPDEPLVASNAPVLPEMHFFGPAGTGTPDFVFQDQNHMDGILFTQLLAILVIQKYGYASHEYIRLTFLYEAKIKL